MAGTVMAKKKSTPEHEAREGPAFRTLGVRMTHEYAKWLEGAAKHHRTTVAGLIDRALSEWTDANGYPTRPPERLP